MFDFFNPESFDDAFREIREGIKDFGRKMKEEFKDRDSGPDFRFHYERPGGPSRKKQWSSGFRMFPLSDSRSEDDGSIIFRFLLPGCNEKDINLRFSGDYMILNAKLEEEYQDEKPYFLNNTGRREYYVPQDQYDQAACRAVLRNGVLKVSIPALENSGNSFKVEIIKEGN